MLADAAIRERRRVAQEPSADEIHHDLHVDELH